MTDGAGLKGAALMAAESLKSLTQDRDAPAQVPVDSRHLYLLLAPSGTILRFPATSWRDARRFQSDYGYKNWKLFVEVCD